ncbi:DUF421 domain-containing protein [Aequorivita sp. CIP111184]|uniref:DUF421 domain-containing protein n=1 Tax=Aequorivita sp. CIP111184 TaxID=2211356 RepID=UPI000DBBF524|nr:YetF domain-containing protein [Aequorivita sp. CIP111184]SRX54300.1 hypothetical protein AEQU1_01309 [Aequorivita sp. CIP111184]
MEKWFETTPTAALAIILSCLGIYIAVILFTRLFGKRSFSKMSSFDFAMTVAVGSIIATTVLSSSVSLAEGVIGLFAVYCLQLIAAYFRRYKIFREVIDNRPLLLMSNSTILYENLKKARVTEGDLRSKLREANVLKLSQIRAVVFETTGDMVVLHTDNEAISIEDWLMEDVALK